MPYTNRQNRIAPHERYPIEYAYTNRRKAVHRLIMAKASPSVYSLLSLAFSLLIKLLSATFRLLIAMGKKMMEILKKMIEILDYYW